MSSPPGLHRPTEHEVVAALADLVGEQNARQVWEAACAEFHGAAAPAERLDDLYRVVRYLGDWPGLIGIVGRSMRIRIETFVALQRRALDLA